MTKTFTRKDLKENNAETFHKGRWANADLLQYRDGGKTWVIKDFSPCLLPVRYTYGKFMARRELQFLQRLQGIKGIPENPFLMDSFALCYVYIPGKNLKEAKKQFISPEYFLALEQLVREIHKHNVVHLDIRYMRNILITTAGNPALLDFQSSFFLDSMPRFLHQLLKDVDISGVYKCWQKINPESMDTQRLELLAAIEKKRSLWIFKGYPLGTRLSRR